LSSRLLHSSGLGVGAEQVILPSWQTSVPSPQAVEQGLGSTCRSSSVVAVAVVVGAVALLGGGHQAALADVGEAVLGVLAGELAGAAGGR
jgi:hypothetical protein